MPLQPFSILTYSTNPAFYQIGQIVNLQPSPGFSASSYSLSGTLPLGLNFFSQTGYITGSPTTLTAATTLVVTATLANSSTSQCTLIIEITDQPVPAIEANTASATGLVDNRLIASQNFLASAEQIINNNNQLGIFWATLDLPNYVDFRWVYSYLTPLNYVVQNLNPTQENFSFVSYFGQPTSVPENGSCPYGNYYSDLTQPITFVRSMPPRRVKISWSPFTGWSTIPWIIPNPYPIP